ncbi:MAG: hypothetical protein DI565_17170 [Ancylobacter novellus]|uniref:Uncharacterized protein n=1 Tax=Ancylobacter novellus TaxID=921 RepID=A0A2W5K557_ANCNO|nr:MAG: hypothetical protein DI565_17170 [Ancylobacter novellus]
MSSIPNGGSVLCEANAELRLRITEFAETLRTQAHLLGSHGLSEAEFYQSGLFRGAIERLRGQFSASMQEKRDFVRSILNYMQDHDYISDWDSAGDANRHDYVVTMKDGKKAAIELKGCLDGNNTNIFERPPHVSEFIIWSVCSNPGADPRHNVWSGIHTRLSAEIIAREQRIDGLLVWDWICGTLGRRCPKTTTETDRLTVVGPFELPPPCIYLFPGTIPSPRNNPRPTSQNIEQVGILSAFHKCFGGKDEHLNSVEFEVKYQGVETMRTTTIRRKGVAVRQSQPTPIQRS